MNIHPLLDSSTIFVKLRVSDKTELLETLVDALASKIPKTVLQDVKKAVFERENIMSTGVGKGLAIPHGKTGAVDENYAAFAILDQAVDYESMDTAPVHLVFLLISPENKNSAHIKLLSRISRLMNSASFRDKILSCSTTSSVLETFEAEELKFFPAG